MERPAELALGGEELVPSEGFVAGPGVYSHDGLELRSGKVVRLDPGQVPIDELGGGALTALERCVERGDRQLAEPLVEFRSRRHASVLDHQPATAAREVSGSAVSSSWRELMSSLVKTLRRWYLTVRGLMNSSAPISGLESPSRASRAI
jgi:hypothetical protein